MLRNKYTLGIVTSRTRKGVRKVLSLAPLLPIFKTIVTQDDTILHKPHPEPLLLAVQKMNVSPNECVYVGDAETDMQASRTAGTKFILYKYNKSSFTGPDRACDSLTELPQLVASL